MKISLLQIFIKFGDYHSLKFSIHFNYNLMKLPLTEITTDYVYHFFKLLFFAIIINWNWFKLPFFLLPPIVILTIRNSINLFIDILKNLLLHLSVFSKWKNYHLWFSCLQTVIVGGKMIHYLFIISSTYFKIHLKFI